MREVLIKIAVLPVRFYQLAISPLTGPTCRYSPTCSQYTIEAIREWGILKGWWMGMRRIASCHPWGKHGHDPVPKNPKRTI
jgi:putative membrane protein insertion efficiency factor